MKLIEPQISANLRKVKNIKTKTKNKSFSVWLKKTNHIFSFKISANLRQFAANCFLAFAAFLTFLALTGSTALAHEHHPPHHGTLVVLGEEFSHVELLLDSDSGQLTAFILDGEAENPVRISQSSLVIKLKNHGKLVSLKLKPVANALTGETVDDTSEYQGTFAKLKGLSHFEGYISTIKSRGESFKDVRFLYPEGNEGVKWPEDKGATNVSK